MVKYHLSAATVLFALAGMLTSATFASHEPVGGGRLLRIGYTDHHTTLQR